MENTRRNAYDAAFKLKAIDLAVEEGNRAAARKLGINESMVRRWRRQREELTQCKKTTKAAIKRTNSIPAVIPGGTTKYLQPLDISVNGAFKVALRVEWQAWMTSSEKSFTKTGCMRRATFAQVCQWILTAWSSVKKSTITNGFRKAGLLRDEEDSTSSRATRDESDIESDNERETEKVCDEVILRLFNSDTEEDDFSGFSAQEEDEDSDE